MAVLVDPAVWPWRGELWAHPGSDVSYDEMHAFAASLGVPAEPSRTTQYDIPASFASRRWSSAPSRYGAANW